MIETEKEIGVSDIVEDLAKFNGKWPYEQARLEIIALRQRVIELESLLVDNFGPDWENYDRVALLDCEKKLAALKQQGEPVAWAATSEEGKVESLGFNQSRRFDTPLYFHAAPKPEE